MAKKTVILVYGGKSSEHDVSRRSAAYFTQNLDQSKYNIAVLAIDKKNNWFAQKLSVAVPNDKNVLSILRNHPVPYRDIRSLLEVSERINKTQYSFDDAVVIPMIHGSTGEDGKIQGLLEMQGVSYIGADLCSSAICLDKVHTKMLCESHGVSVVPYVVVHEHLWALDPHDYLSKIGSSLKYPLFVKPARLGSSVGITKVASSDLLAEAIRKSFTFDSKILVEQGIDAREIEFAVMGDSVPSISQPGEVITNDEVFYDYNAKYISTDAARVEIPAQLSELQHQSALNTIKKAWLALGLSGFARVDLFLCKDTGETYLNEVNTIPGFTSISQFPLLWKHAGMSPRQIIDSLIELAAPIERRASI